jgi:hypothetical protein
MDLEVFVGAIAKEFRPARPEVGEPGDVLLGRQDGCLVKVDGGHCVSPLCRIGLKTAAYMMTVMGLNEMRRRIGPTR